MNKSPESMTFKNNKGRTVKLKSNLTIADLVKLGMKGIEVVPPTSPLKDNWYREV